MKADPTNITARIAKESRRILWKTALRLLTRARGEAAKAAMDAATYGVGVVTIGGNGEVKHIPFENVLIKTPGHNVRPPS